MTGDRWSRREDGSWERTGRGPGRSLVLLRPAVGFLLRKGGIVSDTIISFIGEMDAAEAWKAETLTSMQLLKGAAEGVGVPMILSSDTWDAQDLTDATDSGGTLWRLLRRRGLA